MTAEADKTLHLNIWDVHLSDAVVWRRIRDRCDEEKIAAQKHIDQMTIEEARAERDCSFLEKRTKHPRTI